MMILQVFWILEAYWKSKHHVWLVYFQAEAFMSLTEAALFVWEAEGSET